jgi:hypothetical protein
MSVRPLAAVLLAVAALGLVACGGDPESEASSGDPTASDDEKLREAQVKFAQCMREQGVNIPDPGSDGGTRIKIGPDSGISPEEFEKAEKACEKYREAIRPELSEEEQEERKQEALEFARCMREHGIDMPDPQFDEDGGVQIRGSGPGFDPDDPDFEAAQKECGGDLFGRKQP